MQSARDLVVCEFGEEIDFAASIVHEHVQVWAGLDVPFFVCDLVLYLRDVKVHACPQSLPSILLIC